MSPNPQETADLITFTEEILNGNLHFSCSASCGLPKLYGMIFFSNMVSITGGFLYFVCLRHEFLNNSMMVANIATFSKQPFNNTILRTLSCINHIIGLPWAKHSYYWIVSKLRLLPIWFELFCTSCRSQIVLLMPRFFARFFCINS